MSQPYFALQKSTQIKFYFPTGNPSERYAVAELPKFRKFHAVQVVCDSCGYRFAAVDMWPVSKRPGLTCSACFADVMKDVPRPSTENEREAAMEKAAKLLRLATSDNPHEAALAAARAQEIIDRYKLNAAALANDPESLPEQDEDIKDFRYDPLHEGTRCDSWRYWIADAVASVNQCVTYTLKGSICIIGRPSDVAIVRPFFEHLVREVERLTEKLCQGNGRSYRNNFRLGAVETINERLQAAQDETAAKVKAEALHAGGESALVVVENSLTLLRERTLEVKQWAKVHAGLRQGSGSAVSYDDHARNAGRQAGHSVSLGYATGALPSGRKALH